MSRGLKFVIYGLPFDPKVGGVIALHLLCHRLNEMGVRAYLWPSRRPPLRFPTSWRMLRRIAGNLLKRRPLALAPQFNTPIARWRDLWGAVAVYPEIVEGNPIGARQVVRWLLHSPGFHTGVVNYGRSDLFFYYQKAFDDPGINPDPDNHLQLRWFNDAYAEQSLGQRKGSAYLMRKGKERLLSHDLSESVPVDGLSHEETARIFNQVERFYSYDPYTMYSTYAALCGCISIVVPIDGVSKEQWRPDPESRFGIAYGEEDIPWAIETRPLLLDRIQRVRAQENEMVRQFVRKCASRFGMKNPLEADDAATTISLGSHGDGFDRFV